MPGRTVGLLLLVMFAGAATASSTVIDPPRIVAWHQIGNIGFGMTHERVEYTYGAPINGNPPHDTIIWKYQGRGVIEVRYDRSGHVNGLSTKSPDYATPSGIRVGIRIPLGKCHRVHGKCQHRWNGFTLRDNLNFLGGLHHTFEWDRTATYGHGPIRVTVELMIGSDGTVQEIWLGRYLHCSWGDAVVVTCKLPPAPPEPDPPAGTRYCKRPGLPGNYLAASPTVSCTTASRVEGKVFSSSCVNDNHCDAEGFACLAYWDGRYDRPFEYTHHAICRSGAQRIEMDEG